jgi:hypothetical protein
MIQQGYAPPAKSPERRAEEALIQSTLGRLRRRIRWYVLLEGVGLTLAFVALAFWTSLGLDRFAELPREVRIILLVALAAGVLLLVAQSIIARLFRTISDRSLAALLERRFRTFGDSLLTSVESGTRPPRAEELDTMIEPARHRAALEASRVRLSEVFNSGPLGRAIFFAVLLVASIVVFAVGAPRDMRIWSQRWLLLDDTPWPKRVALEVLEPSGLASHGIIKVARESEPEVVVRARLNTDEFPEATYPQIVQVRYRSRDTFTRNMDLIGEPSAEYQDYSFKFAPLSESVNFDLIGDDGRVSNLRIQVVDRPVIKRIVLDCEYPAYTGLIGASLDVSRSMNLPRGTFVRLRASTNKPLEAARVSFATEEGETTAAQSVAVSDDGRTLSTEFLLMENMRVFFELDDRDGISSAKPEVLVLTAVKDEPPQVAVRPNGVSITVTSRARVPMVGTLKDDFGFDSARFDYDVEKAGTGTAEAQPDEMSVEPGVYAETESTASGPVDDLRKLNARVRDQRDVELTDEAFEIRDLKLVPGDKVTLRLVTRDRYQLGDEGPNQTISEDFPFRIVTVDQLRSELDMRELSLRQRLESIILETQGNRRALADRFVPEASDDPEQPDVGPIPPEAEVQPPPESGVAVAAQELQVLQSERSLQLGRKNAAETVGVAEGFEGIVEELINNRVENTALRERLGAQVATPLREIGEKMFPELEARLLRLQTQVREATAGEQAITASYLACEEQIDSILTAMQTVLDRIQKLQDINELLALFREIKAEQEEVGVMTEKMKQEAIRQRLEDLGLELE